MSTMKLKKEYLTLILLVMLILLTISVVRSWIVLSGRADDIKQAENRLEEANKKNDDLKKQLAQVESEQYIEKEARNKLNMGKSGETVLLLPTISVLPEPSPTPYENYSNFQKWLKLFD